MQSSALSGKLNSNSGNSLISDLTTPDMNNSSNSMPQFTKISKLTSDHSPTKPLIQQATTQSSRPAPLLNASSLSSRQLTKKVSKMFQKQSIEHIDEQESKIVYQLMSKHKITREQAVRMFLEEHDERLYNPRAVYLFPGEEYTPEEDEDDSEEERRKEAMFGRVEYNHKVVRDSDSVSEASPTTIEQRLIGAKKDPDQEALEHALLISAQEEEFGINMYDSLNAEDQIVLAEYMQQGFTRDEGALMIFEEKFGKTSNMRNSSVIPAMPTLHAVHGGTHSYAGTDPSNASDEDDDEEVEDLIRRGYTREQAIAVMEAHREKALRAASTQHPTDPTHYYPHPDEERFNLSEREERDVEAIMSRQGFSRRVAVESVVNMRQSASSAASVVSHSSNHSNRSHEEAYYGESSEVRRYMDRGYSLEQARQLVRRSTSSTGSIATASASVPTHRRAPSGNSSIGESYEEPEVTRLMNQGYTREQAREIVRRKVILLVNIYIYYVVDIFYVFNCV